jgi:amino-acid N-acetyltransferase
MIRKATLTDGPAIHKLVNSLAQKGLMLARPLSEIYENIRDYFVIEEREKIVAVAGLHINWEDLAEIKSVAVDRRYQKKGLGREVVQACLDEGLDLGIKRFYVLTYVPDFFKKMGFKRIDRAILPHKVWTECVKCPKFPDCDEIAMIRDVKEKKNRK